MKAIAICAAMLLGIIAIVVYLYNPYMNGVAHTQQRECERTVLLELAYKFAESRHELRNGNTAPAFQEIINGIPPSTEIKYAGDDFIMNWDIVNRDRFNTGDTDKTVVLFPDTDLAQIDEIRTPLVIHVSSSFTQPDDNCVLMVFAAPEIDILGLRDHELTQLLDCESPDEAFSWYMEYCNGQ